VRVLGYTNPDDGINSQYVLLTIHIPGSESPPVSTNVLSSDILFELKQITVPLTILKRNSVSSGALSFLHSRRRPPCRVGLGFGRPHPLCQSTQAELENAQVGCERDMQYKAVNWFYSIITGD
jgi:hypothetical protein